MFLTDRHHRQTIPAPDESEFLQLCNFNSCSEMVRLVLRTYLTSTRNQRGLSGSLLAS